LRGAFDGGATEVYVNDSHGGFRNLLPDELDPRARAMLGKPRVLSMMGGLEDVERACDGVCMVGYHARAQSRGVLAHTINSFAFARHLARRRADERGRPLRGAGGRATACRC
jgi:D-amino peptidase